MRLPAWVTLAAWLTLLVAVYLPIGQLGLSAVWGDGRLDSGAFGELLLTQGQWGLLKDSILLAAGATGISLVLGLPYAVLCQRTDLRGRSFFELTYLVPLLIPPYMQAIVWGRLLAKNGPVNDVLRSVLGMTEAPLNVHSLPGAMFVLGLAYFPFVTLLAGSGLRGVDSRYEEAARLQAGAFRTLARITLPLIRPHIFAGAVFVFVFSLIDFGVPDILRVRTYPTEIFIQFSALYDERAAVLLGLPLMLVAAGLISLQVGTMRGRSYISEVGTCRQIARYSLGNAQFWATAFCAGVLAFAVVVPVGALALFSGSLRTYQQVLETSSGQIGTSVLLAAAGAGAMVILAFFLAHSMVLASERTRTLMEYLTQLPFAVSPLILGIGLIELWNRPATDWLYGSFLIIVLGYLAHFIPFTIRAIYSSLRQLDPRLEEIGWMLGRSRLRVLTRITLPLVRNGLITGFFIGFVLALGDLGVTLLVIPPGMATIPIKVYNFLHYGAEDTVAAFCVILVALQLLVSIGLLALAKPPGSCEE
jgi:iron(III) transport system permease protein